MYKCRYCQFRHGGCKYYDDIPEDCNSFQIGGCFFCKHYHWKDIKYTAEEIDKWFERGCEVRAPSSLWCDKKKPLSRKQKKKRKKQIEKLITEHCKSG